MKEYVCVCGIMILRKDVVWETMIERITPRDILSFEGVWDVNSLGDSVWVG